MSSRDVERPAPPSKAWPARYAVPRVRAYELRAMVGKMKRHGEIDPHMIEYREEGDRYVAYVMRARPVAKRMPRVVAWSGLALSTLIGIGWLLWESRYVLLALAFAAAGIWWAATRGSHSGLCPGLHCPGCRGHSG